MKLVQTLSLAVGTAVLSASSGFAQEAPVSLDMSQVQGGEAFTMGLTEATTGDGSALAVFITNDLDYGNGVIIDATVLRVEKDEFGKETAADGSILADDSSVEKTVSASGTITFGNQVENEDDIDGNVVESVGNDTSSSVDL